jgi:hypothetical protein
MVEQLRKGLPYRQFLAALYLASIRAARWHGDGMHGWDHTAYVIHSAHQLSLDLPAGERLLPAFYALSTFGQKSYPDKQMRGTRELTGKLPAAEKAIDELHTALREWNSDRMKKGDILLYHCNLRPATAKMSACLEQHAHQSAVIVITSSIAGMPGRMCSISRKTLPHSRGC